MAQKLLVLGIDAPDPALVRRWAREGVLPALGRVLDTGLSGPVQSVRGFYVGSTWPSFSTGLDPSGHGFHRTDQLRTGSYEFYRPSDEPDGVGGTPFWEHAAASGREITVVDIPHARADPAIEGRQIVEWGGHDPVFGFQTAPPELRARVMSEVGEHPVGDRCDSRRPRLRQLEPFLRELELAVRKRTELTLSFLAGGWSGLFVQVFTETHCVGHMCWHLHDPRHPAHDPELAQALGDPIERVYRAVDRGIGEILERVGDTPVLVVAPHGMACFRGADFLLPRLLEALGVTTPPPAQRSPGARLRRGLLEPARAVWRRLPEGVRESVRTLKDGEGGSGRKRGRPRSISADPARSSCFAIPNGTPVSGIRLNLAGREPGGLLKPGAEAEAFCEALSRDLREIIDERTGRPLIEAVVRTDALYSGDRVAALPDLLVEWDGAIPTGSVSFGGGRGAEVRVSSPKIGRVRGWNARSRSGEHVPEGLFAFTAPGMTRGAGLPTPVSVMDFHPTICRLLELDPVAVDGAVIEEVVLAGEAAR